MFFIWNIPFFWFDLFSFDIRFGRVFFTKIERRGDIEFKFDGSFWFILFVFSGKFYILFESLFILL